MKKGEIDPPRKRRNRGRRASRLQSGFSSDGEVEVRGNMVYLRGHALEELKEFAREYRMTLQAAFLAILRCGLPLVLAEHRIGKLVQKLKAASHKGARRVKKLRGRSINR
jgi:hypothetical protein